MKFQKHQALLVLVGALLIGGLPGALAQEPQISAEARAALHYFLQVDCEVDTRGDALSSVLKFRELIPLLAQALREGPDAETSSKNDRSLEEQWNSREQYLKGNPSLGLKDDQVQLARQVTKESYIKTGRENLIKKYRQKAAVGLAAFNTPDAQKALQAAMNDPDESVRAAVKAAQSRMREKKK
jgi:hypothetical protein